MSGAITIHIDTLDFSGLGPADARRASGAFETELATLLERHGLPAGATAADLERIRLGALPSGHGSPESMGRALAQAIFAKLGR